MLRSLVVVLGLILACTAVAHAHPPSGIVVDGQGNVYFVDFVRNRILALGTDGKVRVVVADERGERLSVPHHLVLDRRGRLYTASDRGGRVLEIDVESGAMTVVHPPEGGGGLQSLGFGGDPFTRDEQGNLYTVVRESEQRSRIVKVTPQGAVETIAGGELGFADATGGQARFSDLHDATLRVAGDGSLWLSEGTRIRRVAMNGAVTTLAGASEPGHRDGSSTEARFVDAMGLALTSDGDLYIADAGDHRIRKRSREGVVSTVAGCGRAGSRDGTVLEAEFEEPSGVAVAPGGDLYVIEFPGREQRPRVRKISGGRVSTVVAAG